MDSTPGLGPGHPDARRWPGCLRAGRSWEDRAGAAGLLGSGTETTCAGTKGLHQWACRLHPVSSPEQAIDPWATHSRAAAVWESPDDRAPNQNPPLPPIPERPI